MSATPKLLVAGAACVLAGWLVGRNSAHVTRLTFLDVGQGDCAVLQSDGRALLIDTGPTLGAARYAILPKLRQLGARDISLILLTHPDRDHVAGVPILAKAFPKARFAISSDFEHHQDWERLVSEWKLPAMRIAYLPKRTTGRLGDLRLDIYCPQPWSPSQDNDGSAFLKVSEGAATAVLSGDASAEAEVEAAAEGDWSAEIVKAGHHGSRTSTSYQWLKETHPKWVVISCGKDNRYGHPHRETLDRIAAAHAQVARTETGDVRFVLRNGDFVRE